MYKLPHVNEGNNAARDSWAEMVTNTIIVLVTFLAIYFAPTAAETLLTAVEKIPTSGSTSFAAQY